MPVLFFVGRERGCGAAADSGEASRRYDRGPASRFGVEISQHGDLALTKAFLNWDHPEAVTRGGLSCQSLKRRDDTLLRKNDAVNDVDDTVAGIDIHRNDVGCAAVRVGKNAATLIQESTLQGADA